MFDDCNNYTEVGLYLAEDRDSIKFEPNCGNVKINFNGIDINLSPSYEGDTSILKIYDHSDPNRIRNYGFENVFFLGYNNDVMNDNNPIMILSLSKEDAEELDKLSYFSLISSNENEEKTCENLTLHNAKTWKDSCSSTAS